MSRPLRTFGGEVGGKASGTIDGGICVLAEARRAGPTDVDRLSNELWPELLGYARFLRSSDPEGTVNEAFARLLARGDDVSFASLEVLRAYLRRAIKSQVIDVHRRRATRPPPVEFSENTAPPTPNLEAVVDDADYIEYLLSQLSPAQREVIELRFLHDLTVAETAERTGKPTGTVKALQHRGLRSLQVIAAMAVVVVIGLILVFALRQIQTISTDPISPDTSSEIEHDDPDIGIGPDGDTRSGPAPSGALGADPLSPVVGGDGDGGDGGDQSAVDAAGTTTSVASQPESTFGATTAGPSRTGSSSSTSVVGGATPSTQAPPSSASLPPSESSCVHSFSGPGPAGVTEGSSERYTLWFADVANVDRQVAVTVRGIGAGEAPITVDPASQNIMWGGSYSLGFRDRSDRWIETGRVAGRVPNTENPADGDQPSFGPSDQSWDYSIRVDGRVVAGPVVVVTVPAGQRTSNPIEVLAWRETLTVDLRSQATTGYIEGTESLMFETTETRRQRSEGVICDASVNLHDNPSTRLIGRP